MQGKLLVACVLALVAGNVSALAQEAPANLGVSVDLREEARAGHFLTHPAAAPQVVEAARDARTLFGKAKEIKRDANVYITPQNIPKNDQFLKAYSAEKAAKGSSAPGLLDIANEAYSTQNSAGTVTKAYSLAGAMRDAVWRKNTAARLRSPTAAPAARLKLPSISSLQ